MSYRCFVKEVINVCTLFSIYLCTILLKALYGHFLGFRWSPLRWPGVRRPPLFRFCQKRMLIQIVGGDPRPLRRPGVRWPPPANEGVAIETPRLYPNERRRGLRTPPSMQSEQVKTISPKGESY